MWKSQYMEKWIPILVTKKKKIGQIILIEKNIYRTLSCFCVDRIQFVCFANGHWFIINRNGS